jgi:hypothetical protein
LPAYSKNIVGQFTFTGILHWKKANTFTLIMGNMGYMPLGGSQRGGKYF